MFLKLSVNAVHLHTSNHSVEDKSNLGHVSQPSSSCLDHITHTHNQHCCIFSKSLSTIKVRKKPGLNGSDIFCHMELRRTVFLSLAGKRGLSQFQKGIELMLVKI